MFRRHVVPIANQIGQSPVHFFRPGHRNAPATQTGFNMADRCLGIKCGKSRCEGGRCIALHQHAIRPRFRKDCRHSCRNGVRNMRKVLVGFHDTQIEVRSKPKHFEPGIQHFTMLSSHTDKVLNPFRQRQSTCHHRHLNCFGPRPYYGENSHVNADGRRLYNSNPYAFLSEPICLLNMKNKITWKRTVKSIYRRSHVEAGGSAPPAPGPAEPESKGRAL